MFVGIDVAKNSLVACAMDDQGENIFHSYSVENNRTGCLKLINLIADNANLLQPEVIKVGMEATNVFWEHCYRLIKNHEQLNSNFNLQIYTVNPKVISNFKKSYTDLPKNDNVDAWVIADRIRFGRVKHSSSPEALYRPLRQITRYKFNLAQHIKAEKARALNLVFLKFSDFSQKSPFGTFTKASMALLENLYS